MATDVIVKVIDASNEPSSATVHAADNVTDEAIGAYHSALDAICVGTIEEVYKSVHVTVISGTTDIPSNKFAQRELKWLCGYSDNSTKKKHKFEIPCPDATKLGSTDFLDITTGLGSAFKVAFEALAKSPAGNACTLNYVKLVGRKT